MQILQVFHHKKTLLRGEIKDWLDYITQKIVDLHLECYDTVTTKQSKLNCKRADFEQCFEQGDVSSVLADIRERITENNADGIFPGPIDEYMDGENLLPRNKLFDRISLTIKACDERIASINNKKQSNLTEEISNNLKNPIEEID